MHPIFRLVLPIFLTVFLIGNSTSSHATHLSGGQIQYKYVSPGKYEVTMDIYRDCSGSLGALWDTTAKTIRLINACGSQNYNNVPASQRFSLPFTGYTEASVICPTAKTTCNGGTTRGINKYTWKATITIPTSASCANGYYLAYNAVNRDNGIGNITNGQAFWLESFLDTSVVSNNSSAIFSSDPMPYACIGQNVSLSFGASDPDGDSLDFYLETARKLGTGGAPTSVQYRFGFSGNTPIPGVTKNSINAKTGDLTFTAPATSGNYVVVVAIDEYKKGSSTKHSTIYRDFQIYFDPCLGNSVPVIVSGGITNITGGGPVDSTTVQSKIGKTLCFEIPFSDANTGDTISITSNAGTILPGTITESTIGVNPANRKVCWTIPATSLASYNVSFFAKDNNCPVSGSASMTATVKLADQLGNVSIAGIKETCYRSSDGTLTANHTGGIGPFNYKWDSAGVRISPNTKVLTNIPANISYTVWVIDSFDFDSVKSTGFNLAQTLPVAIASNGSSTTNIGCDGGCTGEIKITSVTGGNTSTPGVNGYSYKWSGTTDTTANPTGLCAGTHLVTISDDRSCDSVYAFFISQPPVVNVGMIDSVMVSCKGGTDGSAKSLAQIVECGVYGSTATKCSTTSVAKIGTGTADNDFTKLPSPFGRTTGARQQYLYLASELNAAGYSKGRINSLSFLFSRTLVYDFLNYQLSIGCTDSSDLDSGFVNSGFVVYSKATHTIPFADAFAGKTKVSFDQEFDWDGKSNIVITICFSKATSQIANTEAFHDITSFNSVAYYASDTSNACVSDSATFIVKTRPHIEFNYCDPGISYAWTTSPVQTADSAINLAAGTYSVVASNLAGCKDTATVTITEPLVGLLLASTTIKTISCNGDTNGSASIQVTGGTPGFTFDWPSGVLTSSDSVATNLKGGIKYTVTVTDAKGCFDTISVQLTEPAGMTFGSSTVKDVDCKGGNDGGITVVAAGGSGVYTSYVWTPASAGTGAVVNSLKAGNYTVRVTDSKLCFKDTTFTVGEPTNGVSGTLTVTKNVTCKGGSDGEASVVPSGGTAGYTYAWSQGTVGTPPTSVTGLSAPSVSVTITDSKGCKDTLTQSVTEPANGVTGTLTVTQNVSCKGGSDGAANVVPSGGTAGYTYAWSQGTVGTPPTSVTDLSAPSVSVTITDSKGCKDTLTQNVTEPTNGVSGTLTVTQNVSCKGGSDGEANVVPSGGTAGYTYAWSQGTVGTPPTSVTGLSAPNVSVTITDSKGCKDTLTQNVTEPTNGVSGTLTVTKNVSCVNGNDGEANVVPSGGTAGYTYAWSQGTVGTPPTSVTGLSAPSVSVTITDSKGCKDTLTQNITSPTNGVTGTLTVTKNVTCKNGNDGEANVVASGGTAGYTYVWSQGTAGTPPTSVTGLSAPSISVTITDSKGCKDTVTQNVTEPINGVTGTLTVTQNVSCKGGNDGEANVVPSGGTAGYTYAWSQGTVGTPPTSVIGLSAPNVSVTITDSKGCKDTLTQNVTEPTNGVTGTLTVTQNVSCKGGSDGEANVVPRGGTAGYTYAWSQGTVGTPPTSVTDLSSPSVSVTITDSKGCKDTLTQNVTEPTNGVTGTLTVTKNVSCKGGNDGEAKVVPSGGTAGYTYVWSQGTPGTPADTVSGLSAPSVSVTITDSKGCKDTLTQNVSEPAFGMTSSMAILDSIKCKNGNDGRVSVTPIGGTTPYTYSWSAGNGGINDSISGVLSAGKVVVTISDGGSCTTKDSITLTEPASVISGVFVDKKNPTCTGTGNDGSIKISISGGVKPYTYVWTGSGTTSGPTDSSMVSMSAGPVSVEVKDAKGCTVTFLDTLVSPGNISISFTNVTEPTCYGDTNGTLTATPLGGTGTLTYLWTSNSGRLGSSDSIWIDADTGSVKVEVTDANGCKASVTQVLGQPDSISININVLNQVLCAGDSSAMVRAIVSGGTRGYTYNWNSIGQAVTGADSMRQNIWAGTGFKLNIVDSKGCKDSTTYDIMQPANGITGTTFATSVDCHNSTNGVGRIVASGGTKPYSYNWSAGTGTSTDSVSNGIPVGVFTVTVTDFGGCVKEFTDTILAPDTLKGSFTQVVNPGCGGGGTLGSVTVTPTGGTPNSSSPLYSYLWIGGGTNGSNDSIRINIPSGGSIKVVVSDSKGCKSDTISQPITAPGNMNPVFFPIKDPLCAGDSSGTVTVTPMGGTAPYTFTWNMGTLGSSDSVRNNLPGGVQIEAYIRDSGGCLDTARITLNNPIAVQLSFTDSTLPVCAGDTNGTIRVTAIGGLKPYGYSWSNGDKDSLCNNVKGNTNYIVSVTDSRGCLSKDSLTLSDPLPITAMFTDSLGVTCNGFANGSLTLTPSNGTPLYSYNWTASNGSTVSTGSSDSIATGLSGNVLYSVTVTDGKGCKASASKSLNEPNQINAVVRGFAARCGAPTGNARVLFVNGGTPTYTFEWDSAGTVIGTGQNINNLWPGAYGVTVKDSKGCSQRFTVNISNLRSPRIFLDSIVDASCAGVCDGEINIRVTSFNNIPVTYKWTNGDTVQDAKKLCNGGYSVTVTDTNSCVGIASYNVGVKDTLEISMSKTPLLCNSTGCNATVTTIPDSSTGSSPYRFKWSSGVNDTLITITNKCAGTYIVTVTDGKGCIASDSATILNPSNLVITSNSDSVSCNSGLDGIARVTNVTGGSSPFKYAWSSGVNDTFAIKTGLGAGTYYVTVSESGGCSKVDTVQVDQPVGMSASFVSTDANCGQSDAKTTATITGGTLSYSFTWPVGGVKALNSDSGYAAGAHNVLVTDGKGCSQTFPFNINNINGPVITFDSIKHETCVGDCDGGIYVSVAGGTPTYTYNWLPGSSSNQDLTSACPGSYDLRVTDSKNCITLYSDTIEAATMVVPNAVVVNQPTGVGSCDAIAKVTPSGGKPTYTFKWSSGSTSDTANSLCAGKYYVTVTDLNGCFSIDSVDIVDPVNKLVLDSTHVIQPGCGLPCDGSAKIFVSGGSGTYTYKWDNSDATDSTINRCAGIAMVTVYDGPDSNVFQVNFVPKGASVIALGSTDVSCNGANDGTAFVTLVSGRPITSYKWTPVGGTLDTAKNLPAGLYTMTAINDSGCTTVDTVRVNEPTKLLLASDTISPNCGVADGKIIALVSGGVGPYSIEWLDASMNALVPPQTGDTAKNIGSGIYNYRVTDKNKCTSTLQVTLSDKNAPQIVLDSTRAVSCFGICDGGIFITASGGTGTLSYDWTPGGKKTPDLDSACAGIYTVKVTDALGCASTLQDTVGAATALVTNVTKLSDVSTSSACDGAASVTVSGGTPVYKFLWTSGSTASVANNLCKGMNRVTVTDSKGCTGIDSVLILEPNVLILTKIDTTQPTCGLCDGKIKIDVSGGTTPYTYKWDNGDTADSTLNRCAGVIRVTVSDAGSLSQVFNIGLNSSSAPTISMVVKDASCNGVCDGSATATASAGASPYAYNWPSLGASGPSITGKCAGVYLVEVRDSKGCIATDSADIKEPSKIIANVNVTDSDCGVSNGTATVAVVGGVMPYKYKWSSGSTTTTPGLTGIAAGAYFVTVEDTTLCSVVLPFKIDNPTGPTITVDQVVNVTCNNTCDGGIFITASGTPGPYTYKWNPGSISSEDLGNQCAGIYTVEVTDSNKCVSVATDTIKGPPAPGQTIGVVSHASAFGRCDGKVFITIPGGTTGYNFQWTSSEVGDTAKALCAGMNYVTITNSNGCQFIDSVLITQPQKLIITSKLKVNPNCNVCDGKVTVTVAGGTPPYSYKWDNGDVADSTTKRCAGIAFLTVTDANNYFEVFQIGLSNSTAPSVTYSKKDANCANSCDGEIAVSGSGTISPYTYNWPTLGIRKDSIKGLCSGTYLVEVKDKVGCIAVQSIDIKAPTSIKVDFNKVLPQCGINTGIIFSSVSGGTPKSSGYNYSWLDALQFAIVPAQTGDMLINVGAGLYHLSVSDSLGCTDTIPVTVNNIGGVSIKLDSLKNASCSNVCDGEISITASSSKVKYLWFPSSDTTSAITSLCPGTHTVEVTDTAKCKTLNTFTIASPKAFKIVASEITDATCLNTNDGKILTLANYSGSITYQWTGIDSFVSTTPNLENVLYGIYDVVATNDQGCTDSISAEVGVRVDYTLKASGDSAYCGTQLIPLFAEVSSKGFYTTTWYDGDGLNVGQRDTISVTPAKGTTNYIVEVRQEVCVQYDTVKIVIDDNYEVVAGKNRTIIKGQRTTLGGKPTAPDGKNLVWTPSLGLDNPNSFNPVATPDETVIYVVSSGLEGGCLVRDTVVVRVDDKIVVNDAFSPNGDGVNDKWEISVLQDYPNAKVQIFNRWGQLLHSSQPYDAWDGTFKGEDMPLGTYYYIIDFNDDSVSTQTISGAVTIIR